jgi:hypothetical protein
MQEQNPYSTPSANLSGSESFAPDQGVTQGIVFQLAKTKGWTRLIGVLAIIGAVAIIIMAIAGGALLDSMLHRMNLPFPTGAAKVIVLGIGLVIGGIAFTYGFLLNSFSSATTRLMATSSERDLEEALDRQRAFWLFWGILSIVQLLLGIIGLLSMF